MLLIAADLFWAKDKGKGAVRLRLIGYCLVGAALLFFIFAPHPRWPLAPLDPAPCPPSSIRRGGFLSTGLFIAALACGLLLLWSVFFEITITKKKRGLGADDTVTTGTYGLCRHPGFWWFSLSLFCVGALKGLSCYFMSVLLMIGLDLLLIVIQDYFVFPKKFKGYVEYKKNVPFLVPYRKVKRGGKG